MSEKGSFTNKLLDRLGQLDEQAVRACVQGLLVEKSEQTEVLQALREGVLTVERGSEKLLFINKAASECLQIHPDAVSKKALLGDVILDEEMLTRMRAVLKSSKPSREYDLHAIAPREMDIRMTCVPLGERRDAAVFLFENVTDAKSLERERNRIGRYETLVRLAAGVAHEIGNPLNAISIHLSLLKQETGKLPEKERSVLDQKIEVIRSETSRLDKITRSFLKATRRPPLRFKVQDLKSILDEALSVMSPELTQAGIEVDFRVKKDIPHFLMDRERLYEAFMNLIKNALEAMNGGGRLAISLSKKEKIASIRFEDTGCGMREEDLEHIFDAYFTTKVEGSGLGLMMVYGSVAEHGGRIEVSSEPGKGTSMTILLPIRGPRLQLAHGRRAAKTKEESR